ncbi:MAG: hypothetical protein HKP16_02520 [Xanthomonadales bacterium]|nr:hypothetical protein [Xanthomonadales bacterium]
MNRSRKVSVFLAAVLASIVAGPVFPASPSLAEKLASHEFRLGPEVPYVSDYRMDERVYVDNRRLILPAADQSFLVEFTLRCFGLHSNRIFARSREKDRLAPGDELLIKHEGRTVDHCEVKSLHQLESM